MITYNGIDKINRVAGYTVDSLDTQHLSTLIAWAPATLEAAPGSNVWHTWLAGEAFFGDWRYRHFRIERNGRVGLFNGETPKAYLDVDGNAVIDGKIIWADGNGIADDTGIHVSAYELGGSDSTQHHYNITTADQSETLGWLGGYYSSAANSILIRADSTGTARNATMGVGAFAPVSKAVEAALAAQQGDSTIAYVGAFVNTAGVSSIRSNADAYSFHGVAPIARQLLATGAGRTVDDVITFLQNLGLARQT